MGQFRSLASELVTHRNRFPKEQISMGELISIGHKFGPTLAKQGRAGLLVLLLFLLFQTPSYEVLLSYFLTHLLLNNRKRQHHIQNLYNSLIGPHIEVLRTVTVVANKWIR